jgi:hypothetical protein
MGTHRQLNGESTIGAHRRHKGEACTIGTHPVA